MPTQNAASTVIAGLFGPALTHGLSRKTHAR